MKLWFETHSTSVDNERGIASGHLDPPLSAKGRLQALELGGRYSEGLVSAVYSSDLQRARSTAEIAFADKSLPRRQDRRLRECDYGTYSGCTVQELEASRMKFLDKPFPEGESFRDVVRRIESFLGEIVRHGEDVLIIGHRAPWYALEHLLRGADLDHVVNSVWEWQPGWRYDL